MIKFQIYKSGLYLPETDISDPANARIGFLFQDARRQPPEFELSQGSWTDPSQQGYFAFFIPSKTRDWEAFSSAIRKLFQQTPFSQFGWFSENAGEVAAPTLILTGGQGTKSPFLQSAFSLALGNFTLTMDSNPFSQPRIRFNDASNAFEITNARVGPAYSIRLDVKPPSLPQATFFSQSPNLVLPMSDRQQGAVNAGFQFATQDLAQFEAGFMYFAPALGPGQPLVALNYPLLRAPGGAPVAMNFSAWLDVLQPMSVTRTFFQCSDRVLGSYLTSTTGRTFALGTVADGDIEDSSRLVLANRPVQKTSETGMYYLAPAGRFTLSIDTAGVAENAPPVAPADLLCGVTGTEFLRTGIPVAGVSADSLRFVPGRPAYRFPQPSSSSGNDPKYLDSQGGKVTTSWVQYVTTDGAYVSQPEQSPLYQQIQNRAEIGSNGNHSNGLTLHLLDFLALPTWKASKNGTAGPVEGPAVPMVPYSGIPNTLDFSRFLSMESDALNPTRKNAFSFAQAAQPKRRRPRAGEDNLHFAMTPQGLLAGLDSTDTWTTMQIATSKSGTLQFTDMQEEIRMAMQQNQIFAVISSLTGPSGNEFFKFAGADQTVNIADWLFSLSPALQASPAPDNTPPILILKFYPGQSIASLVSDLALWSQPDTFNTSYTAEQTQEYIQGLIQQACEEVYGEGNCPDGSPEGEPNTDSPYYNFYQTVTDPAFSGLLALNCNIQLEKLPGAIRAILGGMTKPSEDGGKAVSNIDAFRAHHIGVQINDTDPKSATPTLAQSSLFGLVDYKKPQAGTRATAPGLQVNYNFEVEYLQALFLNSALSNFACQINLTINNLFDTPVELQEESKLKSAVGDDGNVIVITGSYQAHSTSGDDANSGQGLYSFVSEGDFAFDFDEKNPYLQNISLTKLQFAFQQETPVSDSQGATTSNIQSSFSIWGSMVFKELKVLDIFSFEKLVFADLGIGVSFDLTTYADPRKAPVTDHLGLTFSPGNLRFDLAQTTNRDSKEGEKKTSLLTLLPFKLQSFLYSQHADQTIDSLGYFPFAEVAGQSESSLKNTFNYALLFDLDLGSVGALVGSLAAFKAGILIGWLSGDEGGLAVGVQLPQADGKIEIKIEGVLDLVIEKFTLQYLQETGLFILGMYQSSVELFGKRLPPKGVINFGLFLPKDDAQRIGWIVAYDQNEPGNGSIARTGARLGSKPLLLSPRTSSNGDDEPVFDLIFLGGGQRVGPSPDSTPTTFQEFLTYMQGPFWEAFNQESYTDVYQPEGNWLALTDFKLLKIIEVGFVFYDYTPFYSLTLNVENLFNFEITYTKVSDSIGLFYANLTLPDSLRTFQVGAASLTLPSLGISAYTNGNWKTDLGFPNADDWSRSFRIEAQAGPVPVTGSGGFYLASLSSATTSVFQGDYPSIIAFGFALRLGVGKDFTAGPLSAGISVTFFGIIEGSAGYLLSGSDEIFREPDALALAGQLGLIGEIYGSIDFKIIKASVNVRLAASIGVVIAMERSIPNSGTILLYVQASVSLSVSVDINLGLFSVSISFSFDTSVRFQWLLGGSASATLAQLRLARDARPMLSAPVLPLCPGLNKNLALWYLPELTVVFADAETKGVPWLVSSLGIEYDPNPSAQPTYSEFKPFEALTTQLVTWALWNALPHQEAQSACSFVVTQEQLSVLDQHPDLLLQGIDYSSLLQELSKFQGSITQLAGKPGAHFYATVFPILPFLQLQTKGRVDHSGKPDDLTYQFSSKNNVSEQYVAAVEEYFDQLFVNQEQQPSLAGEASAAATIPLAQEIFMNYFTGLIRGAVHQLLQVMEDEKTDAFPLDELIRKTVGAGQFKSLAGQMSASFRGGVRLPYTPGLTVPGGQPLPTTNALYALLWQEFPAGQISKTGYHLLLTNPDSQQTWLTANLDWQLTQDVLTPYSNVMPGEIVAPSEPMQLPFTNVGPQSFSFTNSLAWTQGKQEMSLRPFPSNLTQLQAAEAGNIAVTVEYRPAGGAYQPSGTPVPPDQFTWATMIQLTVKQVPGEQGMLPDIYALSGASQQDQALLQQLLEELKAEDPIASIQVLYQSAAGATGLNSAVVDPKDVFVLRTNTTTVAAPPSVFDISPFPLAIQPDLEVGATLGEHAGFLQIIQQAVVTNAAGYYLRYVDAEGKSLPKDLFTAGPAPLTILITYRRDVQDGEYPSVPVRPFYNSIVLSQSDPTLLYYAETTAAHLNVQYSAVAPGSAGILLTRDDSSTRLRPNPSLASACGIAAQIPQTSRELIRALVEAGVTDEQKVRRFLAESGAAPAQLNALYSLITYQVAQSTGFIASNLSAPIQPQQPAGASRLAGADIQTFQYRVFVPLYKLADANQGVPASQLNRYASIGDPFSVAFFQNDAFGNQMPGQLGLSATNLYFDPILPVDQWQGVVTAYDFLVPQGVPPGPRPQPNTFTLRLVPSSGAFSPTRRDKAIQLYQTIYDQITGPGVSFYAETNLALNADRSMVRVALTAQQSDQVIALVSGILKHLRGEGGLPNELALSFTVAGAGELPPAFEMAVLFGIERDKNLISPLLKDQFGDITFPSAQNVSSNIASTVGATIGNNASVDIEAFAANFVAAFPALALSVGLNTAQPEPQRSSTGVARSRLKALGIASDGSGAAHHGQQSLWAVQRALLDVSIGQGRSPGPFYLSPKPLDNALNTGVVPLPQMPAELKQLPKSQLFADVDLDQYNSAFFAAVDNVLGPASAAQVFEQARAAYDTIAEGRASLAKKYSEHEIDWLFGVQSPFTGSAGQLEAARETFKQQMLASLMTSYAVDTVVQYEVNWVSGVPAAVGDEFELFGEVQLTHGEKLPEGFTLSTAHVPVVSQGSSLLTFLFGTPTVRDVVKVDLDLQYNVTHIQHFLKPANQTPKGQARPSMWLQLVNPYLQGPPHIGPEETPTTIPLVFREYPTPPTVISQSAGTALLPVAAGENPLVAAAAWDFIYQYQAQLTVHDEIISAITYNTDLSAARSSQAEHALGDVQLFTLFQALARFQAAYVVLRPILNNLADPNWPVAVETFAELVQAVVDNTNWNPVPWASIARKLANITDVYAIIDSPPPPPQKEHTITLSWDPAQGESSYPGVTLSIEAIDPTGVPYPNQQAGKVPNGITDTYVPEPPLKNDWIRHQVTINGLNVLSAENALAAVQLERNRIVLKGPDSASWSSRSEFIYMTPIVRASQPLTPFLDSAVAIDVAKLPNPGINSGRSGSPASLYQRVYTMMYDLLSDPAQLSALLGARNQAGLEPAALRRVKVGCSYQYPVAAAAGVDAPDNPVSPLVPVALARSFEIDGAVSGQLAEFASLYAEAIQSWRTDNKIDFGPSSHPTGAQLVFDITLYAQLSGLNMPILRLRNLQLKLADVSEGTDLTSTTFESEPARQQVKGAAASNLGEKTK